MRVLVTGAQGCIGAWSVRKLLDRGVEVVTYDVNAERPRLSLIASEEELRRVEARVGSIEDTARVKALVRDGGITHIIHLAAVLMPFCQQHPVQGAMVNVIGTLNVFEAARDAGRPVRVVYASSSAVWGPGDAYESRKLNEDDPLKPATHYGVFKQSNEGNARVFFDSNGISSVGLRPWSVYGVGRDSGLTADPTLAMRAVACGESFEIRLSGHMDLQFVEDVAETFLACLFSPLEGAHVFNLAGDIVEMNELIALLESMRPGAARLITARGPQVPVAYRMDDSQLRAKIANIPRTPLKQGVEKTLAHFERLKTDGRLA
ncbi:MAG: SDR family oxidoreductase [Bryobacteraceae bacterium]|nr:SDR family oxidoreductase [Bryobacterales bacterium]NUN02900.1 SDR family oxidoreductase [Bryobacteraceae bacterium]